jgi:putative Ig domain-containing protein
MAIRIRTTVAMPVDIMDTRPQDRTPHQKAIVKAIEETNLEFYSSSKKLVSFEPEASKLRLWFLFTIAAATTLGTVAVIVSIARSAGVAATLSGGAVALAGILVAGLVNPLATVERDVIFRRWSDTILYTYFLQAGDENLPPANLKTVADEASSRFAALGATYATATSKSLETLQNIGVAGAASNKTEPDKSASPSLSVTAPGDQTSTKGAAVSPPLHIIATGGDVIQFKAEGLPDGVTLDEKSGVISGTPTTAGDNDVIITVTDEKVGLDASVKFKWTIAAETSKPAQ